MESTKLFLPLLFIVSLMTGQGLARLYSLRHSFEGINKLHVFGDSYVDTGNLKGTNFESKDPNGITWPGKPAGRFSDGYVLTDYFASFLGLESPIPYMQLYDAVHINGINFAFGGSGVFDTVLKLAFPSLPNLNDQINFLEWLIYNCTITPPINDPSIGLVSVSGNDYMTYLVQNLGNIPELIQGLKSFIRSVVDTTIGDLKRIHGMGVKKVVITTLGRLECVPMLTMFLSYERCVPILNLVADHHNNLLKEAVAKLNNETKTDDPTFYIIDLHAAFSYVIQNNGYPEGNVTFPMPLEPCNKGNELCKDPKSIFYWDYVHPSHQGWLAAFSYLTDTLKKSY